MSSLSNITFQLTLRVSYTHTELFGSHHGSLTSMFYAFHLRGLMVPFLLRLTHIIDISFYVLNCETLIGRRPKYVLTTHSSTPMMDDHTHAHTSNMLMSHAYEMQICHFMLCHATCIIRATCNIYKFWIIIFPIYNFYLSQLPC